MKNKTVYTIATIMAVIILILQIWGNWNHWIHLEEKDNTIKKLREELKVGIFVEVYTDKNVYRRTVNRNDSGHIFIPEDQGFAMRIKARSVWEDSTE